MVKKRDRQTPVMLISIFLEVKNRKIKESDQTSLIYYYETVIRLLSRLDYFLCPFVDTHLVETELQYTLLKDCSKSSVFHGSHFYFQKFSL